MKLHDLWNNVMLQGEIRIKVYDHNKDEYTINRRVREFFNDPELTTWRDLFNREITYIYPQCNDESLWEDELVIELEASE